MNATARRDELPPEYVLDTFALLALLHDEPGAERVRDLLGRAARGEATLWLSGVNAGEVAYVVERETGLAGVHQYLATLRRTAVTIADVTWERILAAAHVKANHALSYADAFAVALAQEHRATVVTGDPEFRGVAHLVSIEWLPQKP